MRLEPVRSTFAGQPLPIVSWKENHVFNCILIG
jgi:hypothetical protein